MRFQVKDLTVHYNKVRALSDVSIEVGEGDIVTLIGANGAGKSTTLRTISGLVRPSAGEIWFEDQRIDAMAPERVVKLGIAHVPEGRHVFPELTVYENLNTGAFLRKDKSGVKRDLDEVYTRFPRLKERRSQQGKTLSGGEQKMLLLSRGLVARPKIMLIDEISEGLQPSMVTKMAEVLRQTKEKNGVAVLLVEQNLPFALSVADRYAILKIGEIVEQGDAAHADTAATLEQHLRI